ncbi:hypothetical protein [Streptomyces sp. KN37]|uniref:hypothetical protein n=1 Tax=Streptomyces sp. KN37 TaxID=3090667 RepID=UPI002A75AA78|nr:hypothetical protein [Streptomyces sp. KN37]WPO69150.1 hypothetical protein R9806_00095 [Streptomyces sp. KN37]
MLLSAPARAVADDVDALAGRPSVDDGRRMFAEFVVGQGYGYLLSSCFSSSSSFGG